ncbi:hypothetical protein [Longispora albida]|uniref:hypothetical protein n=1 Tax=Longispora albida TaxID=203523 RepID=UPI00036C03A1|nr:hypothetical protein [Longispora albida]
MSTEKQPARDFTKLPERVRPEDMVATQDVTVTRDIPDTINPEQDEALRGGN